MANGPITCGVCGLALGLGVPGTNAWCGRCESYVLAEAQKQDWGGVAVAVIALVVAIVVVAALRSS